jgi:hypothetical protein
LLDCSARGPVCLWCDTGFEPRKGGSPQRFCNSACRDAFHSAGRRWAEIAVLRGLMTAADLRNGPAEACTLLPAQEGRSDHPTIGYEETALSEAQRASARKLQLELSIAADGILDLCTVRVGYTCNRKLLRACRRPALPQPRDLTTAAVMRCR